MIKLLHLVDNSLQSQTAAKCDLLIHIGTSKLQYAIIDKVRDELKALAEYELPEINNLNDLIFAMEKLPESQREFKYPFNKIRVSFRSIGGGLIAKNKFGFLRGFAIAGADKQYHWANAYIEGDAVVVFSPKVQQPVALRYAWADNPGPLDLYNVEGLPAFPFRTDDWPLFTAGKVYLST